MAWSKRLPSSSSNPFADLEERSFLFAKRCRDYVHLLPQSISNFEYGKQLIRSSGSQAANYLEANESLSKKDFILRVKIAKKETKESRLWLKLTQPAVINSKEQKDLIVESIELMKIFGAILERNRS